MKKTRKFIIGGLCCLAVMLGIVYYYFFSSLSKVSEPQYVYIDNDDTADSVLAKVRPFATASGMAGLSTLVRHSSYGEHIHTGRYEVEPGNGALTVFRHLKNGLQKPINLTVPSVRTVDRLSATLSKRLLIDSLDIQRLLTDEATCKKYGFDTLTIIAMFIPNTYDMYWNITPEKLLDRMEKEYKHFWNSERQGKAKAAGLTPVEVSTLASIIDEETANDDEKPMVAGMYINRLKTGMPLQADPTVKFALKDFGLRRIYNYMLFTDSPYNTYRNTGLPPGPIRVPSVAGLDAVLDHVKHDYLYMCAKEDFSGTHNFARTYDEHLANARRYSEALNRRGIK